MENFKLEKGSAFPEYDDNLFFVMGDYDDFPESIIQRINKLINHYVEKYEEEHPQHLILSECELSVYLDIDRHTKDMGLNFVIIDDKRKIDIDGKDSIKPNDNIYSDCRNVFMYQLEEFLFAI